MAALMTREPTQEQKRERSCVQSATSEEMKEILDTIDDISPWRHDAVGTEVAKARETRAKAIKRLLAFTEGLRASGPRSPSMSQSGLRSRQYKEA